MWFNPFQTSAVDFANQVRSAKYSKIQMNKAKTSYDGM